MKNLKTLLIFALTLIFSAKVSAQILQTRNEVIDIYGEPFHTGVTEKGENFHFYKIPITTKSSGTYDQRRIMFFKTFDDGSEVCYKFKIVEPSSETLDNIASFSNDLVQTDEMQWKDYGKGIVYSLKEIKGVCLITAEYKNEAGLVRVYKF